MLALLGKQLASTTMMIRNLI